MSNVPHGIELELIKYLLRRNKHAVGKLRISYENLGSKFKTDPEATFLRLKGLADKGIIDLIELPIPHTIIRRPFLKLLEFDAKYLFSKMPLDEYEKKRQLIAQEFSSVIALDKDLACLTENFAPLTALEACARTYDALCFLERLSDKDMTQYEDDILKQNKFINTEIGIISEYLENLTARIHFVEKQSSDSEKLSMETSSHILDASHLLAHVSSLRGDLDVLVVRHLVGEQSDQQFMSELRFLLRKETEKKLDSEKIKKYLDKVFEMLHGLKEKKLLDESNYSWVKRILSWNLTNPAIIELDKSTPDIVIELKEIAEKYLLRCGIDNRILDGSFQTVICVICGSEFCILPCGSTLIENKGSCPRCGKEGFPNLQYLVYLARLEQLHEKGKINKLVYEKLKQEYEAKRGSIL